MPLQINAVLTLSEQELDLLAEAIQARLERGSRTSVPPRAVQALPRWHLADMQHGVRYTWGKSVDYYDPFWTYAAEGDERTRLAIGVCQPTGEGDRGRKYLIAHRIGPAGGKRAVAEFLATDDHDKTAELIAIVKGKGGSGSFFDVGDALPEAYDGFRIERYCDRVARPGSYDKAGLVVAESDHATMLAHTWIQIWLRGLDAR